MDYSNSWSWGCKALIKCWTVSVLWKLLMCDRDIVFKRASDFLPTHNVDPSWTALRMRIQLIVWGCNRIRDKLRRNVLLPCSLRYLITSENPIIGKLCTLFKSLNKIIGFWVAKYRCITIISDLIDIFFSGQVQVCVKNPVWGEKCFWRHKC